MDCAMRKNILSWVFKPQCPILHLLNAQKRNLRMVDIICTYHKKRQYIDLTNGVSHVIVSVARQGSSIAQWPWVPSICLVFYPLPAIVTSPYEWNVLGDTETSGKQNILFFNDYSKETFTWQYYTQHIVGYLKIWI